MSTEAGRAVVTARIAGRPRRLATERQWRAAVANGDLAPETLVQYEGPTGVSVTSPAREVPELEPLFAALVPGFVQSRSPPEPPAAPESGPSIAEPVTVSAETAASGRTAPLAPSPAPSPRPSADPQPARVRPSRTRLGEAPARHAAFPRFGEKSSAWPKVLGLIIFALMCVLALGYGLAGDPQDSAEKAQPATQETSAADQPASAAAKTAPVPEPEAKAPKDLPKVGVRDPGRRDPPRSRQEVRPPPSPTPAPTRAPIPPAVASRARAVQPRNLARWASQIGADYPRRAAQREEEGTVGFRVTVGINGRVESCEITRSSGSADLDNAACQGLRRYARFEPALDDAGEPIASTWSSSVRFRLN